MWQDVTVIPPLTCGLLKDRLVEVDLWMSGGGTKSILHKDAYNAINCLYNGTKEWKMIEYKYEDKIYKAWEPPQMVGGYSRLNVHAVDLLKYPKVSEVPWSFVTVHAGDCLFLPKSKWFLINFVQLSHTILEHAHLNWLNLTLLQYPLYNHLLVTS